MRKLTVKFYRKAVGGAILFQVLLGLGLMVMMSPLILNQIKKYNEEVRREDVINDMSQLQKAVSSFIVFNKDNTSMIKDGVTCWKDATESCFSIKIGNRQLPYRRKKLQKNLEGYLKEGSLNTEKINSYGLEYYFITVRNGNDISSILVASCVEKGCIDRITLNGIGQFLFDKGSIIQEDKELLGDVKLSPLLQEVMKVVVDKTKAGAMFMYTTDEMVTSDFLYRYLMPGSPDKAKMLNTMLVNLNMNNNNIKNVKNLKSSLFKVDKLSKIGTMVVDKAVFDGADVNVKNFVEYAGVNSANLKIDSGNIFPFAAKNEGQGGNIYLQSLTAAATEFKGIDLKDADLAVSETVNIVNDAIIDLTSFTVKTGEITEDVKTVSVGKATVDTVNATQTDKTETKLGTVLMKDKETQDAFVYVLSEHHPVVVNLSGSTEVEDIVINGEALSKTVGDTVTAMKETLAEYLRLKSGTP